MSAASGSGVDDDGGDDGGGALSGGVSAIVSQSDDAAAAAAFWMTAHPGIGHGQILRGGTSRVLRLHRESGFVEDCDSVNDCVVDVTG